MQLLPSSIDYVPILLSKCEGYELRDLCLILLVKPSFCSGRIHEEGIPIKKGRVSDEISEMEQLLSLS